MSVMDAIKKDAAKTGADLKSMHSTELEAILNRMFYLPVEEKKEREVVNQEIVIESFLRSQEGIVSVLDLIDNNCVFCLRRAVLATNYKKTDISKKAHEKRLEEARRTSVLKWRRLFARSGYTADLDGVLLEDDIYHIVYKPDAIVEIPEFYGWDLQGKDRQMLCFVVPVGNMLFDVFGDVSELKQIANLCMHFSGVKKAFVIVENRDDMKFRVKFYDYDPDAAKKLIDRANRMQEAILRMMFANKMTKRPDQCISDSCSSCADCRMREACWNVGNGRHLLDKNRYVEWCMITHDRD